MAVKTRKQTLAKPHIIIDAGPGCGKTTTTVEGFNIMSGRKPVWYDNATDEQQTIWDAMEGVYHSIGFQAFNKSIATELAEKLPKTVDAKTFHSFGYGALRNAGFKTKMSQDNVRYMIRDLMGYNKGDSMKKDDFETAGVVKKVVGLLKNNLLDATTENILQVVKYNNIETNGNIKDIVKLCTQVMDKCKKVVPGVFSWIDFDDMLWLPIILNLDFSGIKYDLLVCDESQDLNPLQHELVLRSGCRLICVGDPRQAIYGFRGADSESMITLHDILKNTDRGVKVLPLQTSFRLPKSAVKNVNDYAPELKSLPNAIEGEINECYIDEVKPVPGDLIVSRINANIFALAFRLLRNKVAVRIQGREFGAQLIKIIEDRCHRSDKIGAAVNAINTFDVEERTRLSKKTFSENLLDVHGEKISCLLTLTGGCDTVDEMLQIIEQLFSNDLHRDQVVLLSTVHRAKGLEADRVWFLEPDLVPHKMAKLDHEIKQEYNLKFVAETRHKKVLMYVHKRHNEDTRDED